MFGFLGFILLFILFIVLIGLALISNVLRFIFGLGKRTPKRSYGQESRQANHTHTSTTSASAPQKKKIFDDNEGEYVEFEEVK